VHQSHRRFLVENQTDTSYTFYIMAKKKKKAGLQINFPDAGLSAEQERELRDALKSVVVAVISGRTKGQVNVQPKVPDGPDDDPAE